MRRRLRGSSEYNRFLLRELDRTPYRLCVGPSNRKLRAKDGKDGPPAERIITFVSEHPGATIKEIQDQVPSLSDWSYNKVRALVVQLVGRDVLKVCGTVPLDEVDGRYERVPVCDLCNDPSSEHKTIFWKYNTPVVRCSNCGLLYANPRWKAEHLFGRYTSEYWDQYASAIKETALDQVANQARWDPYLDTLELARKNNRLLDVGCATGEFLLAAKARGWEIYGVETSPVAAEYASRVTGARIHTGTLETTDFADQWFDVVTMWDVIEHLQSPRSYMRQAAKLLRNDGVIGLTTPNIRSLAYLLLNRDWDAIGPNDHLYYFSPRTLEDLLKASGFAVHHMGTTATEVHTWNSWLKPKPLKRLARLLRNVTLPLSLRFLWGDELYVVGRRV